MANQVLKSQNREISFLGISALLISLLLFFIDEGYYNFDWMLKPGNWVIFTIYVLAIFLGQLTCMKLILRGMDNPERLILSILLGSILGFVALALTLFSAVLLQPGV